MLTYDDFKTKLGVSAEYGRYFSSYCPFHPDRSSPSLLVFKDGWFKCLSAGCNRIGNWRMLWGKLNGQSLIVRPERRTMASPTLKEFGSLEELSYQAHLDLQHFSSYQWYIENRKLDGMIDSAEIGYYRGWYTFPVKNAKHEFVTAVFRSAPHVQELTGTRYWCNHQPVPYAPDWNLLESSDKIIVVFGIMDALSLVNLRFPAITSTAGADTFKARWLDAYRKPIYIIPDKGEEQTALKLAGGLGWRGSVYLLQYPDQLKDVNDLVVSGKERLLVSQLTEMVARHDNIYNNPRPTSKRKVPAGKRQTRRRTASAVS